MAIQLTTDQLKSYDQNGYITIEDLVSKQTVEALSNRLREYTHGGRPSGAIRMQIEPRVQRQEMQVAHAGDGIRKVDNLVKEDDLFHQLGLNHNIVGIISQILGTDLKMFRNSLLMKAPEVGSQKGWHQDSPYWPIEPMDLCSCWFTLDDATPENGCLAVLPGWHKRGSLPHISVTDDYVIDPAQCEIPEGILAPVKAGGGVFFHSLLPHYTAPNKSGKWRRAIALSYMSSKSRHTGSGDGPTYLHIQGKTYPNCVN